MRSGAAVQGCGGCGRVTLKENGCQTRFYRSRRRRAQVPNWRLVQWWRHHHLLLRHRIQLVRLYLYPPLGGLPRLLSPLPLLQMSNSLIAWSLIAQIPLSDDTPILNFWEWVDTCLCHAAYIFLCIRVCMFFLVRFRPMAYLDFLLPLLFYKWYRGSAYLFFFGTQIWFLLSI